MFASSRTGAFRWLRLGLAVVALFATKVNVTMGAFGTTCDRSDSVGAVGSAAVGASGVASVNVEIGSRFEAPHHSSQQESVPLAAVPQCGSSVGAPTVVVDARIPLYDVDSGALPLSSQLQPPSRETAPPFRPPRET